MLTLKHLSFGDYFISWIEIILKDIITCVKTNGFLTDEIEITRGVRQGDPLSALLHLIIADVWEIKLDQIKTSVVLPSEATNRRIFNMLMIRKSLSLIIHQ